MLTEPVLVAAREIPAGTVVTEGAFARARVPRENVVRGAVSQEEAGSLYGSVSAQMIPQNQQIVSQYFSLDDQRTGEEESVFVLPEEWILMRSSSLRKGDWVTVYGGVSLTDLGTYRAVFVRDQSEQEVTDPQGARADKPSERVNSTAPVCQVEIAATLDQYQKIRQAAQEDGGLVLVQETPVHRKSRESQTEGISGAVQEKGRIGGPQQGKGKRDAGGSRTGHGGEAA